MTKTSSWIDDIFLSLLNETTTINTIELVTSFEHTYRQSDVGGGSVGLDLAMKVMSSAVILAIAPGQEQVLDQLYHDLTRGHKLGPNYARQLEFQGEPDL